VITFFAIAIVRLPLAALVLSVAPVSVAVAWWRHK
jgi:hypothetical protein